LIVLGIDPGLHGALAWLDSEAPDRVDVEDTPVAGSDVDGATVARLIEARRPATAIIEQVGGRPGDGGAAAFKFGASVGAVRGVLAVLRVPVSFVSPARWKSHFRLSADKDLSRRRALELFPHSAELFARKCDHNRAEAALIALWYLSTAARKEAAE
jgi:hypothetical protein